MTKPKHTDIDNAMVELSRRVAQQGGVPKGEKSVVFDHGTAWLCVDGEPWAVIDGDNYRKLDQQIRDSAAIAKAEGK